MSDVSYISPGLKPLAPKDNKDSGAGKEVEKKNAQTTAPAQAPAPAPKKIDPYLKERHLEFLRTMRDMKERLTEAKETFSAEKGRNDARSGKLENAIALIDGLEKRLVSVVEPDPDSENYRGELASAGRTCEEIRLELIRTSSALAAENASASSPIRTQVSDRGFEMPSNSALFKKGFFFFLPLGITILVCTILLAAAFVAAWKITL